MIHIQQKEKLNDIIAKDETPLHWHGIRCESTRRSIHGAAQLRWELPNATQTPLKVPSQAGAVEEKNQNWNALLNSSATELREGTWIMSGNSILKVSQRFLLQHKLGKYRMEGASTRTMGPTWTSWRRGTGWACWGPARATCSSLSTVSPRFAKTFRIIWIYKKLDGIFWSLIHRELQHRTYPQQFLPWLTCTASVLRSTSFYNCYCKSRQDCFLQVSLMDNSVQEAR